VSIDLDAGMLTAAATQLSGTEQTPAPATAQPPGADMTSASAVGQLNAASAAFAVLLAHGSAVRQIGALSVANTATFLTAQDDLNAAGIANGSDPGMATGLASLPTIPSPTVPTVPAVPAALVPLPGEAHAQALYGGPGSSSLHDFADHWSQVAAELRSAADTTTQAGNTIDASWNDGKQRAGANTRRHGEWLSEMVDHADALASHARSVATSFETAKHSTPSPHEFEQAKQELHAALARFQSSRGANAAEVQQKSQQLAQMQTQAITSATTYHSAVTTSTLPASSESLKTAPAIAGGENASPSPDDTIVGGPGAGSPLVQAAGFGQGGAPPLSPQTPSPSPSPPQPQPQPFLPAWQQAITGGPPPPGAPPAVPMPAGGSPPPPPPSFGDCFHDHMVPNLGEHMVSDGFESGLTGALAGATGGAALTPEIGGLGGLPGGVLGFVGGFSKGVIYTPLKIAGKSAAECLIDEADQ
jgi:hypothetical protein